MSTVQLATRVDQTQDRLFRDITRRLGTTPADAMRVFVSAFNQHRGFPFDVRLIDDVEPFTTEEDATSFASGLAGRITDATR